MTGHILRVESHYDDGMEKASWFYVRPGLSAEDAHASLARRWRDAGYTFTRDKKTLTLTRHRDSPEIGGYTDVIIHEPMGDES